MSKFWNAVLIVAAIAAVCWATAGLVRAEENDDLGIIDATPKPGERSTNFPICGSIEENSKALASMKPKSVLVAQDIDKRKWFVAIDKDGDWLMMVTDPATKTSCLMGMGHSFVDLLGDK